MRTRSRLYPVMALGVVATVVMSAGCGKKSGKSACAKLAEQISACGRNVGLEGDEDEKEADCKKKLKAGDKDVKEAIPCARHEKCSAFRKCMQAISERRRAARRKARLEKRFAKIKAELKAGKHYSATSFCKDDEKHTPQMKKWCGGLNKRLTDSITAKLLKARDAMKVGYKETSACDTMLGYAIKVSKKAGDDAGKLCQELKAVKDYLYLKKQVEEQLKKATPYFSWSCHLDKIKEKTEVNTPFARKLRKMMVQLCYYKLGKKVFAEKVPKMKWYCSVKKLYQGYKELKVTDAEILKLMDQASKKCEPKKK